MVDWVMLGQATGSYLKPEKYCVYFQIYKFVHGKPHMKKINDLPTPIVQAVIDDEGMLAPAHTRILQSDGSTALIPTLEIT